MFPLFEATGENGKQEKQKNRETLESQRGNVPHATRAKGKTGNRKRETENFCVMHCKKFVCELLAMFPLLFVRRAAPIATASATATAAPATPATSVQKEPTEPKMFAWLPKESRKKPRKKTISNLLTHPNSHTHTLAHTLAHTRRKLQFG